MEIKRLFYSAIRKWWLILLLAVLGGSVGYYVYVFSTIPMYTANTTLYALNRDKVLAGQAPTTQDIAMSQQVILQYSGIFYSKTVAAVAAKELEPYRYHISDEALTSMSRIYSQKDVNLLTVSATSIDPEIAATVANAMGSAFASQMREFLQTDFIGVLDEARVPLRPVASGGAKKVLMMIVAGIVAACGIIYVLEYFDTTIRSAEEIEEHLKMRIIGIIPDHDVK
jgi:capsular polysaccharide biosynthesis protein